ncbi:MAG: transketolase [Alphaproteobacteria bacterium]|nr:transketolase [Alphaproteobacteria bacterium]
MRNHLIELIAGDAAQRPDVVFMTGDLGFSVVEPLRDQMGDRFINTGVAEANMVSMAAALGLSGFEPYVYSITPFVTARCFEQIRNDVCYHGAPVRLVGIGAGFSYGTLGPTHHALEDATIMAALPAMTVFSPATLTELDALFDAARSIEGPIYYRIGRENGPTAPMPAFVPETPVTMWRDGSTVNLVTSGCLAEPVFAAADALASEGIDLRLITVPILAPFPAAAFVDSLAAAPTVIAFEGYAGNPLEAGALNALAENGYQHPVKSLNAGRAFACEVGSTDHQRRLFGLSPDAICDAVRAAASKGS